MLLVTSGAIALAAERLSADPRGPSTAPTSAVGVTDEIASYMVPVVAQLEASRPAINLPLDPFEGRQQINAGMFPVASAGGAPTVSAAGRPGRQLTAILIADDRQVAVIDGVVVNVGDVLPDGARVASIRADRVSLLEKNGQFRVITMLGRR